MSPVTIRPATPRDESSIRRLAALDSAPAPSGRLIVAEVEGSVVAAMSATRAIADPFRPTQDLVAALRAYLS